MVGLRAARTRIERSHNKRGLALSPLEAIKVCTMNGATYLGRADKVGSIAAGKQADLVVIDGDPSANIADVRKVNLVFREGVATIRRS